MVDSRRVIFELRAKRAARLRYHRAVLTICRWGGLDRGRLGRAIKEFSAGDVSAEELCWEFAKDRVKAYTPSFSWDEAQLERVLELVVETSTEPKLSSVEPIVVAEELVAAAEAEREAMRKHSRALRKQMAAVAGMTDYSGIVGQASRQLGLLGISSGISEMQRTLGFASGARSAIRLANTSAFGVKLPKSLLLSDATGELASTLSVRGKAWKLGITSEALGLMSAKPLIDEMASSYANRLPNLLRTAFPDPAPWLTRFQDQARRWLEESQRLLPANWRELSTEELRQVVDLMTSEGLGLAWAPREEILIALLEADDRDARVKILEARSDEIVEDVEQALGEVAAPELTELVVAGNEAIATFRDGHPGPAQTYATSAIRHAIHDLLGFKRLARVRKRFSKDPFNEVGMQLFPLHAVGRAIARVHADFDNAGEGFNSNLTQHHVGSAHSEAKLLQALLLLASVAKEFERTFNRQRPEEAQPA